MAVVPTCDLCDAHKGDTSGAFRVLPPVFPSYGGRAAFAGPVRTVKCFEDNTSVKALLEGPGNGQVLVVDGGGSLRRALVGGNIAAAAARNGWAGGMAWRWPWSCFASAPSPTWRPSMG